MQIDSSGKEYLTRKLSLTNSVRSEKILAKNSKPLSDHVHVHEAGHSHEHNHSHGGDEEGKGWEIRRLIEIGLAALLFGIGIVFNSLLHDTPFSWAEYLVLIAAYLLVGRGVVLIALRNLRQGEVFDENFLMSVATLGAIAIHLLPEAVAVMLFYAVGEYFQERAVNRSRRSIRALLDIRPDYANVEREGRLVQVAPDTIAIGETIAVKPGERIPLDGTVIEGSSFVDTSALTGESVPRRIVVGDEALAGTINTQGLLKIQVSRSFGESSVSKILQLVENASSRKAPTEAFISTFSRYYTPVVVVAAGLLAILPPLLLPGATFSEWIYRALVLLVISCPCALVVSIPLGYFGGIGGASRRGILVKGANYLDGLTQVDTVVMDKTGTLTRGVFKVTEVTPFNGFSHLAVLESAAYAENYSSHPIATSIKAAYDQKIDESRLSQYEERAGYGIKAQVGGKNILAGNDRLLHLENIPHESCEAEGTVVYVVIEGNLAGRIIIADEIKPDANEAVRKLHQLGVKRVVMLTGDDRKVAERVARQVGVDEVYAELLPEDKVATLEKIAAEYTLKGRTRKSKIAFVGDGINDAPVLTRADVGIAMGGLGSDAAVEAADVVIMDDAPSKLPAAMLIARRTRGIVIQNIALALGVKTLFVILGTLGIATIWEAVFADVGVSLLAILNATRALRS